MLKASRLFRQGGYNICIFETDCQAGVTTIKMYGFGWRKPVQFKVKNFGERDEKIIEDEEVRM